MRTSTYGRSARRVLVAGVAVLGVLLAACGGGASGVAGGGDGPTRVVTDELGNQVTVPVAPRRVATMHFLLTMGALDLGLTPTGTAVWSPANVPDRYAQQLAEVPVVTTATAQPELEKVAAQAPDLILATSFNDEQVLGRLRQIAPTYVFKVSAGGANASSWTDRTSLLADVLGRGAERDRLAADFEAKRQALTTTYSDRIRGTRVAIVYAYQDNNATVFSAASGSGSILRSLGFTYSAQADAASRDAESGFANVSSERIGSTLGDADILFLGSDLRGQLSPQTASLQRSRFYQELPAVLAGRVGAFKPQVTGYTDATFLLDQVEKTLQGRP